MRDPEIRSRGSMGLSVSPSPPGSTGDRPGVPSDCIRVMREFLPQSPFVRYLGLEVVDIGAGTAVLRVPWREEMVTIGNTVHGGVISSLIDTTAMVAAWSDASIPDKLKGSTVSLTINYVAPAKQEDVTARAVVVRRGRRLTSLDVEATTPSGGVVAKALVTYQIG